MGQTKPISPERAEELKRYLAEARANERLGIGFNTDTGRCVGPVPLSAEPRQKLGVIGKYDTHYAIRSSAAVVDILVGREHLWVF